MINSCYRLILCFSFVFSLATTAIAVVSNVTKEILRKMNPTQVAKLLKANGASDKAVANFLDNDISGKTIVDGISDEDFNDLGFKTPIQRRGIKDILQLIISNGSFQLFHLFVFVILFFVFIMIAVQPNGVFVLSILQRYITLYR
jgi:hypothetical protein